MIIKINSNEHHHKKKHSLYSGNSSFDCTVDGRKHFWMESFVISNDFFKFLRWVERVCCEISITLTSEQSDCTSQEKPQPTGIKPVPQNFSSNLLPLFTFLYERQGRFPFTVIFQNSYLSSSCLVKKISFTVISFHREIWIYDCRFFCRTKKEASNNFDWHFSWSRRGKQFVFFFVSLAASLLLYVSEQTHKINIFYAHMQR